MTRAAALVAAVAVLLGAAAIGPLAPVATAQELRNPGPLDEKPALRSRTGEQVVAIAQRVPEIRDELERTRGETREVFLKGGAQWQVSWFVQPRREIAQVIVDDRSGAVLESYTGFRVAWTMARGYEGAFGRKINHPLIWIGLLVLFAVPFLDPRRPWRWLHLDVLVLAGFSVSLAFFNAAEVETSVPLVYPLLGYLLVRMLAVGLRRRGDPEAAGAAAPASWVPPGVLLAGLVFLLGFRLGLNLTDSNVIDVGYAGVLGADRLADGDPLYGGWPKDNEHGDTYGPIAYAAYLPFEQLLPWSGTWDDLPAAHAAALVFDVLTVLGLFVLGRRIGGRVLGITIAYAWAAFPFTAYVINTNANDTLISLLLVGALLLASSAPARGAFVALAGMAKFAPLALAPLFATHGLQGRPWRERLRRLVLFGLGFAVVVGGSFALTVDDVGVFWERTIDFQAGRDAPFSLWGLHDLNELQVATQVGAVLLALVLAVVPRRDDLVGLCALGAAVIVAVQITLDYWFYLYLVWFLPLALPAMLATVRPATGGARPRWRSPVRARRSAPARP